MSGDVVTRSASGGVKFCDFWLNRVPPESAALCIMGIIIIIIVIMYYCIIITIAVCASCAPIWGQHVFSAWRESIHCSHNVASKCFQVRRFAQLSPLDIWTEWLPQLWGDGNSAGPFKIMCHIPEEKLSSLHLPKTMWFVTTEQAAAPTWLFVGRFWFARHFVEVKSNQASGGLWGPSTNSSTRANKQ